MARFLPLFSLGLVLTLANSLAADDKVPADARKVVFNRDIRPILADTCYLCHGPAKTTRKADLRLDTEAGAFADLGGYQAIVPGKLQESHLWLRITAKEEAKRMPPVKSGRQLTPPQID